MEKREKPPTQLRRRVKKRAWLNEGGQKKASTYEKKGKTSKSTPRQKRPTWLSEKAGDLYDGGGRGGEMPPP